MDDWKIPAAALIILAVAVCLMVAPNGGSADNGADEIAETSSSALDVIPNMSAGDSIGLMANLEGEEAYELSKKLISGISDSEKARILSSAEEQGMSEEFDAFLNSSSFDGFIGTLLDEECKADLALSTAIRAYADSAAGCTPVNIVFSADMQMNTESAFSGPGYTYSGFGDGESPQKSGTFSMTVGMEAVCLFKGGMVTDLTASAVLRSTISSDANFTRETAGDTQLLVKGTDSRTDESVSEFYIGFVQDGIGSVGELQCILDGTLSSGTDYNLELLYRNTAGGNVTEYSTLDEGNLTAEQIRGYASDVSDTWNGEGEYYDSVASTYPLAVAIHSIITGPGYESFRTALSGIGIDFTEKLSEPDAGMSSMPKSIAESPQGGDSGNIDVRGHVRIGAFRIWESAEGPVSDIVGEVSVDVDHNVGGTHVLVYEINGDSAQVKYYLYSSPLKKISVGDSIGQYTVTGVGLQVKI